MDDAIEQIKKYVRAANYLTAAQLYLRDNFLLERALQSEDIKPRLLGHWGTCPGINFVYAHLNYLIKKHNAQFLFVLGPGHGFPALQANLFLEGTLGMYYPEATRDTGGIGYIVRNFSWPYGFPSHSNPEAPGVILEGGELGYSLSTAYGAVLDNPDLLVACLIGDGEAETAALATAWHINKFIDPKTNGAVLPILHLNGYKISGPTIFGRMSNKDLKSLFRGYGYEPYVVEGNGIYEKMADTMEKCYQSIRTIQQSAGEGKSQEAQRFPMIILKTPKGWTGIKKLHGKKIEGNCLAHQIVGANARTDKEELHAIERWMRSYHFKDLIIPGDGFVSDIHALVPDAGLRMGENKHAFGGPSVCKDLILPEIDLFAEDAERPGTIGSSSMRRTGLYLKEVFALNESQKNIRLFSPDETYSNKLDAIFETTSRAFMMSIKAWDKDLSPSGRVIEMLSEHSLQGLMQGYVLTGRHAIFASYEAFIQIVGSMVDQYAKFLRIARETSWHGAIPSLNYILTSSGWRQEHNGFSHQNPGFLDNILQKEGCFAHVYFPPDGNSTLVVLKKCLASKNEINVIVAGKTQEPRWLTPALAAKEMERGLMIWDFASDLNPDVVVCGAGDYMTKEALAAVDIVKTAAPEARLRFVNIIELSAIGLGNSNCQAPAHDFNDYFTKDKPVIFNFHGYPETLRKALFNYQDGRFSIHGYIEHGSTTTPFDMHVRNTTSRYHLAKEITGLLKRSGSLDSQKADHMMHEYDDVLAQHTEYIKRYGVDMPQITQWQWTRSAS